MSTEHQSKASQSAGTKKSTSNQKPGIKMPDINIPDLSAIRDKIQVDKILSGIKSLVNQDDEQLQVDPKDALGNKVKALSTMMKDIAKSHDQLSKDVTKANNLLSQLFKAVEVLRSEKKK